jgi:hypothetical protein
MANEDGTRDPGLALKIGIGGAIAVGALASGLLVSRRGRRLVREAFQGRRRTTIEDRVLDTLWGDPMAGRRTLDVKDLGEGVVEISGVVRDESERDRVLDLAEGVRGVNGVEDRLDVEAEPPRRRRLRAVRNG